MRFGSNSNKYLPKLKELMALEDNLIKLVKEIKIHRVKNEIQSEFKDNIKQYVYQLKL